MSTREGLWVILPIHIGDVRDAIESRHVPQCYEQILRTVQDRLGRDGGTASPQTLSRHVRTLLADGDVVELVDHATVASLGAFPQHFRRSTKFFIGVDVARDRLGAAAVDELLTRQRGNQAGATGTTRRRTTARDEPTAPPLFELSAVATDPATARPSPSARPATDRRTTRPPSGPRALHTVEPPPRRDRGPDDMADTVVSGPPTPAAGQEATVASAGLVPITPAARPPARTWPAPRVTYGVTGSGAVVSSLHPQFSSGPPAPAASGDQALEEITARLAQILDHTARVLGDYVDHSVLPLNRAWHEGGFGADADRAADRLSRLYTVATTYRDDLAAVAATLGGDDDTPDLRNGTRG